MLYPVDTHFNESTTDSFRSIFFFSHNVFYSSENCIHIYDIIPLFAAELEVHKIGMWGKGLTLDMVGTVEVAIADNLDWDKTA